MSCRYVKLTLIFFLSTQGHASWPKLWNLPCQDFNFIGREEPLSNLEHYISKHHLVAIVGLAGIGKTSLAKQFAIKNKKNYQVVWFIDLQKDLDGQLHHLAIELKEKKLISTTVSPHNITEGVNIALSWLRSTEESWLLIFDNFNQNNQLETILPDLGNHPHKHVLITTRYNQGWCKKLPLNGFSNKEASNFLEGLLGELYQLDDLKKLSSVLGNHPRALLQAAAHISRAPGMTCNKYIDFYHKNVKKLSEEEKMILTKQEASVALYSSLEMLLEDINQESPESLLFLATLSYMSCSYVDEAFLTKAQEILKHDGRLTYKYLIEPSLLVKDSKGYSIHPYVATVVRNYVTEPQRVTILENGMGVLASYLDKNMDKMLTLYDENPNLLGHTLEITKHYTGESTLATELEVAALFYLFYFQRRYDVANLLAEQCKERIERRKNFQPSLAEGRFYSLYSFMVYDNSTLTEAISACLKAASILEQVDDYEAKDELILLLCNNLMFYYGAQGDTEKIEECIDQVSKLIADNESLKNQVFLSSSKLILSLDTGEYEQAKIYLQKSLEKIKGSEIEKSTSHILYLYAAKIELKKESIGSARHYAEKAYQLALDCVGHDETHETVARAGIILALCELYDANISKAELLTDTAIASFTESYQSDSKNRLQAYAHMVKGDVLIAKQDLEGALESYTKALKIYQYEFTNMKVDDVSELYSRFINLGILMKNELLAKDYLDQHIDIFGIKHPRSIAALKKIQRAA